MALIPTLDATTRTLKEKFLSAQSLANLAVAANAFRTALDTRFVTRSEYTAGGGGIAPTIIDAKGDLIVGLANDTPTRLAPGTAGQTLIADTNATAGVAWKTRPALYTNLVRNPSVETNTTDLLAMGAGTTLTRTTSEFFTGTAAAQAVADGTVASQGVQFSTSGGYPAGVYSGAVYAKATAGTLLKAVIGSTAGSDVTVNFVATGAWQRVVVTGHAMTATGGLGIRVLTQTATAVTIYADAAIIVAGISVPDYFDGETSGCYWTGTAHGSTSVRAALAQMDSVNRPELPVITRNLVKNPSFELAVNTWSTVAAGTTTLTRNTTNAYVGVASVAVACDGTVISQGISDSVAPPRVTAGTTYTGSVYVLGTAGKAMSVNIRWGDESGTNIGQSQALFTATGVWQRVSVTGVAPATAASGQVRVQNESATAHTFYVDAAQLETGNRATAYVDGDQPGCFWTGTGHASESVRMVRSSESVTKADAPELARNFLINPTAEVNLAGIAQSGTVTLSRITSDSYQGSACVQAVCDGASAGQGIIYIESTQGVVGVVGPGYFAGGLWVKCTAGVSLQIVLTSATGGTSQTAFTATGSWQWAATGSVYASGVGVLNLRVRTATATATTILADNAIITQSSGPLASTAYFDGDSQGCFWTGTPHNSPSVKYLEQRTDTMWDRDIVGTGSPEGVYAAPVGTKFTDTAATNGALVWVKATGTGSTGWRVQNGDTGWRNVSASLVNGWAGEVYLRRIGSTVFQRIEGLNPSAATSATYLTGAPSGFQADQANARNHRSLVHTAAATPVLRRTTDANAIQGFTAGDGSYYGDLTYTTAAAWPSTLPGTTA